MHTGPGSERPSVGLALSGGGAHGIAHLGILKVMEEEGLRPDYITGVSMGSIVGGLYAVGYSADSLLGMLRNTDWATVLSNRIPEYKVVFPEKELVDNSVIALPLSKSKIRIPSGLINGQVIENMLNYHFWPAADINDFSKLPIPFSCLSTDIVTYSKIEHKKGYLPDAVRASFAVPSIFTPLKIDTLLLVDGGLIRNFAASEARNMGADIVIGSYVGFEANTPEQLQTVSGIIEQIAMYRSLEDFKEESKLVDILITPKVDDLPVTVFENVDTLFMRGYKAASAFREKFRRLADSLNAIAPQEQPLKILGRQTYSFDKIEITGNRNYSDNQILGILDLKPGQPADRQMLSDRIDLLYGREWFEKIKYRIVPRNDSLVLVIDCTEMPGAMMYGSVHYDNSLLFGLKVGFSVKNAITHRSSMNFKSFISRYYRISADFTQFIDVNQRYALSASLYADRTVIPRMTLMGDRGQVLGRTFTPSLGLGKIIGLNNMMNIGLNWEKLDLLPDYVSDADLKSITGSYLTGTFRYQANTLDRKHFPDRGTSLYFSTSTSRLTSGSVRTEFSRVNYKPYDPFSPSERFWILRGSVSHYYSTTSRVTFGFAGEFLYMSKTDTSSARSYFFSLGGIEAINEKSVPMTGFHPNQIQVNQLAGIRTEMDIEPLRDLHFTIMADVFAIREAFSVNNFRGIAGVGLGAGYMSPIGPVKAGLMYGTYGEKNGFSRLKGYISLGYRF